MITAYSTQPRIEPQQKQTPKFDTLDDLIAAMKADAEVVNRRQQNNNPHAEPKVTLDNQEIADLIEAKPGITAQEIADYFRAKRNDVHSRLLTLERWKCVKIKMRPGITKKVKTYHRTSNPVEQPCYRHFASDGTRAQVIAFIKANPGCTTNDVADHIGKDRHKASRTITKARIQGEPIRSERTGNNKPNRHYWEGE